MNLTWPGPLLPLVIYTSQKIVRKNDSDQALYGSSYARGGNHGNSSPSVFCKDAAVILVCKSPYSFLSVSYFNLCSTNMSIQSIFCKDAAVILVFKSPYSFLSVSYFNLCSTNMSIPNLIISRGLCVQCRCLRRMQPRN